MVASTIVEPPVQPQSQDEVDLTDEQIQQLLLEAEGRLRGPDAQPKKELDIASLTIPKLSPGSSLEPYVRQDGEVSTAKTAELVDQRYKKLSQTPHTVASTASQKTVKEKSTAGSDWFGLPKTEMTTEFKRDLQLLRMRSVLDPKRHYKKENTKAKAPEFSQVGTIIQGPTEFFSSRINKKDRKKTFVEETLAAERQNGRFESKYRDIQSAKTSGKKAYYNSLRAKRSRGKQ